MSSYLHESNFLDLAPFRGVVDFERGADASIRTNIKVAAATFPWKIIRAKEDDIE